MMTNDTKEVLKTLAAMSVAIIVTIMFVIVLAKHMTIEDAKAIDDVLCIQYLATNISLWILYCN
jgi:hypothetical protein